MVFKLYPKKKNNQGAKFKMPNSWGASCKFSPFFNQKKSFIKFVLFILWTPPKIVCETVNSSWQIKIQIPKDAELINPKELRQSIRNPPKTAPTEIQMRKRTAAQNRITSMSEPEEARPLTATASRNEYDKSSDQITISLFDSSSNPNFNIFSNFLLFLSNHRQVRREKISERMKLLQNLVPGCNKVWMRV